MPQCWLRVSKALLFASVLSSTAVISNGERVAICIIGRLRALKQTLEPFQTQVLNSLCGGTGCGGGQQNLVDVFLYAPNPTAAELEGVALLFPGKGENSGFPSMVRNVRFEDESQILDFLSRNKRQELLDAMRIKGNWIGSAGQRILPDVGDRRKGTGLFQMYAQEQCLEMIEQRELKGGAEFDRVILTRSDLRWLVPHPPLHVLSPDFAWVPDTLEDDWGGLYDRHFLVPRWAADFALGGWRMLTSGTAFKTIAKFLGYGGFRSNGTNTEVWLGVRLQASGVRVSRFPMTAYLGCDMSEWLQAGDANAEGDGKAAVKYFDAAGHGSVHGAVHGFVCHPERDYRYPKEYRSVRTFAGCLAHNSANGTDYWSSTATKRCYCDWFEPRVKNADPDVFHLCFSFDQQ
eukprot:TRINITY_DN6360_c1_g1_i2.p1 TRINITY_DN6360_c1_g1~~TRINITY_DN6360_c1_g1_i2.p1  ORF type:complete len:404 (+),score=54.99 TRINITY_DN6360_c1_g1_i2:150-1361(+)